MTDFRGSAGTAAVIEEPAKGNAAASRHATSPKKRGNSKMRKSQFKLSRRAALKLAGGAAAAIGTGSHGASAATNSAAELFLTDVGTGTNVMLLHGWTCDSNDWNWQLPAFESKYRVVAPDLRGHGSSEVMASGAYAPDDYVADLEALIANEYPDEKFVVMGHSMGGQIAARLAAKRPDLVHGVVYVDGSLGFDTEIAKVFKQTVEKMKDEDPGRVAAALFEGVYAPSTDPALKRWHARRVKGMPSQVVRESFGPLFFGDDQVGVAEASAEFCKTLSVPVYHLCRDPAQAERMRPWFSNRQSKVDVWSDTGHWIMQDRKKDVNAAVAEWIDAL